ncbi:chromosome partition protein MukE [Pseudaeromonas pectinilytica]|jgi:chromosome partition protein MukE|nr:chromosome partition protein MukE [Aeromonadaceae bacterium]
MSLINTDFPLALRMAQAIANPLFPKLDTWLRSGRHISADDLDNHSFLLEYHDELERFYARYQVELIKAPEGFFYLRPRASSEIGTSVLSELDMLVGKVLCYLYLSPERLANEGLFSLSDLQEELLTLADERQLLRMVNQRSGGSDLDKRKLLEKMRTSLRRLKRLGMVVQVGTGDKFRVNESVFRFGADVRSDEDPRLVQLRMIREGEAILHDDELPTSEHLLDESEDELEEEQLGLDV